MSASSCSLSGIRFTPALEHLERARVDDRRGAGPVVADPHHVAERAVGRGRCRGAFGRCGRRNGPGEQRRGQREQGKEGCTSHARVNDRARGASRSPRTRRTAATGSLTGQRRRRTRAPTTAAAAPRRAEVIRAESSISSRQESGLLRSRAATLLAAEGDRSSLPASAAGPTGSSTISSSSDALVYSVRLRWPTMWFPLPFWAATGCSGYYARPDERSDDVTDGRRPGRRCVPGRW